MAKAATDLHQLSLVALPDCTTMGALEGHTIVLGVQAEAPLPDQWVASLHAEHTVEAYSAYVPAVKATLKAKL